MRQGMVVVIYRMAGCVCVGGFLLSLVVSLPDQQCVPWVVRKLPLLTFLYCYQQFGRLLATGDYIVAAVQSRKAPWPGPLLPDGSALFRRFLIRTGVMVVPIYALVALIFPSILVGADRLGTLTLWATLVVGAILSIVMYSRAYDDGVLVMAFLEQAGLGQGSEFAGVWKVVSVNKFGRVPATTTSSEFEGATRAWLSQNPLQLWLNPNNTAHVLGGGEDWSGHWVIEPEGLVRINGPHGKFLELHYDGRRLVTLPDKTFLFERE